MPSPVGHSLMGLIVYRATGRTVAAHHWQAIALYMLAANAADLDFLPGLLVGDLARFHHGPSHSILFAIFFGILAGIFFFRRVYAFVAGFSLYFSHVMLDYLVQDPSPPLGVPLFWPFSREYYMAPFGFFRRFDYLVGSEHSSISVFFSLNNVLTVLSEILFLLPLLLVVWFGKSVLSRPVGDLTRSSR